MVKRVIGVLLIVIVLGAMIPAVLPKLFDTAGDISSLNVTAAPEAGGLLQTMWPIVLMVLVIGVAAGLVFFALRRFNIIK